MSAKLVELIESEERIGNGKRDDPFRNIRRWYTKEGQLVVEHDEWKPEESEAFRQISITVMPDKALRLHDARGEWAKGQTYKFWHPNTCNGEPQDNGGRE